MEDISGYGLKVKIVADKTFPAGFTVTQFADDADPFDLPSIQIADKAMGLNGDLVVWAKATPIGITLNVISASADDTNLGILFQANRPGKGKQPSRDKITMVGIYPNGKRVVLNNGKITDGMPAYSVASSGRQKSKAYMFTFENDVSN